MTTAKTPPSRERVVVLDRAASVACADHLSRFARAAVAAAPSAPTPLCVPSSLLLLASLRQLNESRHDERESAARLLFSCESPDPLSIRRPLCARRSRGSSSVTRLVGERIARMALLCSRAAAARCSPSSSWLGGAGAVVGGAAARV